MADGISIREFARRAGCDDKVVRRKLESGHLHRLSDGTIDPAYLDVDWRSGDPLPADSVGSFADSADVVSIEDMATRMVSADGKELWSKADAEKVKENYAARLKQLEYDRESAAVVTINDAATIVAAECDLVRDRLRRLGAEIAPGVAGLTSAAEIKAAIDAAVVEALTDLSAI